MTRSTFSDDRSVADAVYSGFRLHHNPHRLDVSGHALGQPRLPQYESDRLPTRTHGLIAGLL